jgi:hypothetical protein
MKAFSGARISGRPGYVRRHGLQWPTASAIIGLIGILSLSLFMALPVAAQGRPPGGNFSNPAVRVVDIAEPAIVRLATLYQSTITFRFCGRDETLPAGGQSLTIAGLGTGAFISGNGDILTADHVVNIDRPELDSAVIGILASNIANLLNANASCLGLVGQVTPDQISYQTLVDAGIPYTTNYSPPQFLAWLNIAYAGADSGGATDATDPLKALMQAHHMTATLEGYSEFTQNDLAILHVDMTDTPSIPIGNTSNLAVQDQLTEIGFPGNGDASHPDGTYNSTDLITPTVETLNVVGIKSGDDGSNLVQVSGALEHGDSGGPALDINGNIQGIVSYSATDDPIGSFFLRSANSARELAVATNISTRPGTFETLWQQAFDDYSSTASGHWHTAASELDALSTRYPGFRGVLPFKQYADQAEQSEVAIAGGASNLIALIALIIALLALVLLIVLLLAARSRRRKQTTSVPAPVAAGGYAPYGMYPPYVPYGYGGYPSPPNPGRYTPPVAASSLPYGFGGGQQQEPAASRTATDRPESARATLVAPEPPAGPQGQPDPATDGARMIDVVTEAPGGRMPFGVGVGAELNGQVTSATTCRNGHAMLPGETYCQVCGMPRVSSDSSQVFMHWPSQDTQR